ncbi:hypothetical protein KDW_04140 [Dictyobacter vulcani]|uniref:Uncharacterized protein n=1 Tax=Dictyobacter vulcani TaxID=2607529 RepID=A0A5J4KHE3_9CHLR|nr:hypothetical protein [Dictyobacter vulcani]GER86252.1 hypothetical protein KDW_04140 [Dictyobacter vulcani]
MLNDKDAVIDQLTDLAKEVDSSDPKGAIRLTELRDAVDGGKYADAWSGHNIYNLINIDAIVNRYRVQQKIDNAIIGIDSVRNICIFLPLFFTWWAISKAIPAYYTLVTQYPKYSTTPFLQLWQGGFNNNVPWYDRLAGVAGIDVVLILFIICLTMASSIVTSIWQLQRDQKAEELRDNLAHALAGASLFLSTRNRSQPINFVDRFNTVVDNFNTVVAGLEAQMKAERVEMTQLAERQKAEFALFNAFKSSLVTSMDNISSSIRDLKQSHSVLDTTIHQLITPTQEAASQQKILLTNSSNIQQQLTRQASAQEAVVAQQKLWGEKLNTVLTTLDGTVNVAKTLAGNVAKYTDEQKDLVTQLHKEHDAQEQLVSSILKNTSSMDSIIKQIDRSVADINGVTVNMSEVARRIAAKVPV